MNGSMSRCERLEQGVGIVVASSNEYGDLSLGDQGGEDGSDAGIDFCFVSLLDDMYSRRDPERFPPLRPRPPGGFNDALRCVQCCLPRPVKRLGPDEFALSARER